MGGRRGSGARRSAPGDGGRLCPHGLRRSQENDSASRQSRQDPGQEHPGGRRRHGRHDLGDRGRGGRLRRGAGRKERRARRLRQAVVEARALLRTL
ncbi:MAG: hypothetical protein NT159_12695 [Proteobacteria bacterium]|nr:hypothetical protein [Pseudomonadota bacterium]